MRTMRSVQCLIAAAIVAAYGVARVEAHHSIAMFDGGRTVKITGIVQGFRWINPHVSIEIDAVGEGDTPGRWIVEMTAPNVLMGEGWKRDSVAVGDLITIFAHPLRNPAAATDGSHRGLYVGVTLPDGKTLGRVD